MTDDPLYRDMILDHWQHPHHVGTIKHPDMVAARSNPTCGDTVSMTGRIKGGILTDLAYQADGCAISVAAASLFSDFAINEPISQLLGMTADALLSELGLDVSPARLNCALLPFQAFVGSITES